MKTPTMTKSYKAELRVLKHADKRDGREVLTALNATNRAIAKLTKSFDRIQAGFRKRADQRARRMAILEGRIHS